MKGNRIRSYTITLHLLVALGVFGCQRRQMPDSSETPPTPPTSKIAVGVARAQLLENTVHLPASIESDETAMLMARVDAYVDQVLVDIGDEVKADQVLVRLRAPELDQDVQQFQARVQQIHAAGKMDLAELGAARAQLDVAEAQHELKRSVRNRLARLVESGAIERHRLEEAEADVQTAAAMLVKYENAVDVIEARLVKGAAEVDTVEAELAEAESLAGYLTIRAPFAGVVARRDVDTGNFVRPADTAEGDMPLLTVAKVDKLRAVFHATSDVAATLAPGQSVVFSPDDLTDKKFAGRLSRTAGTYDERSRMMRAEVDLDNRVEAETGRRPLRAGSYGSVEIVTNSKTLPVVPQAALRRQGDTVSVVVVRDGVGKITPVEIGIETAELVGIATGIAAGEQFVLENPNSIAPNQSLGQAEIELKTW